jgi:protein phosphatase
MKLLIISDLHAKWEALNAIQENWDRLFCLGDLVDYGTSPHEIIRFVRENMGVAVRGNHDHAVAYDVDCGCAPPFHAMSVATRELMKQMLRPEEIEFLRSLPEEQTVDIEGSRFYLCHAAPTDHLYRYLDKASPDEVWEGEAAVSDADVILIGHTHQQFVKRVGRKWFVNPGSVGLSRDHPGKACYAIWNDGNIELKQVSYDVQKAIERVRGSTLPDEIKIQLERAHLGPPMVPEADSVRVEGGQGDSIETMKPISAYDQVRRLNRVEKLLLAQRAERYERIVLATEPDPEILFFLCKNPKITLDEILRITKMTTVNGPVVEFIARNASWIQSEEVRMNLVLNPRTPLAIALRLLSMLHIKNVRAVARNQEIRHPIKQAALRLVLQRTD